MAEETCITLYDVASRTGECWNPISMRTRYALKFMGIPYKTAWLEYPDIEPTLRSIGAAPTGTKPDGSPFYTIPVISDPSHPTPSGGPTVVSDSWAIAEYLDDTYPSPNPLLPEGTKALQALFQTQVMNVVVYPAIPTWLPRFLGFLNEESLPYFRQTREGYYKRKLEDICPKGTAEWEETWERVREGLSGIATLLDKNGKGAIFVMGVKVTYADLFLASVLDSIALTNPDEWESRVSHWEGGRWKKLRERCAGWRKMV